MCRAAYKVSTMHAIEKPSAAQGQGPSALPPQASAVVGGPWSSHKQLSRGASLLSLGTVVICLLPCCGPWLGARRCMQGAVRAALGELARGASTGVILWSGSSCPACQCSPQLSCPEQHRCADCVCSSGERVVRSEVGWQHWAFGGLLCVLCLLVGLLLGAWGAAVQLGTAGKAKRPERLALQDGDGGSSSSGSELPEILAAREAARGVR